MDDAATLPLLDYGRARARGHLGAEDEATHAAPVGGAHLPQGVQRLTAQIVVEQLSKNVNEGHLREIFGKYGPIKDLSLPMNPVFNVNRGTAYIMYEEIDDAERAIAKMHEAQLDGAQILVSIVLPRRRFSRSPPNLRQGPPPRRNFDYRPGGPPGGYRPPPMGGPPRYRSRSPPGGFGYRGRGGRGGGRGRGGRDDYGYRPRRSISRSRSRSPRRSRSRSSYSRSPSRTPPRRGSGYRRRDSPPPRRGGSGRGGRRRSPSYSDYSDYSRSRSRSRGPRR
ncbi:RNA-binding domain-containing protein [Lentithecium fluviatile CBS 122367]|uniref:RNA-binding domain-containing protein n=1 Tax=Lentithecium fluviatile CBS 122367 TaxID=1168545 RepID=A0A6G1J9F1_9PLEO|nr:RNA-binding domain-containing protein [Lentithecium fluviatile CBS 122367]